jgi:RimJ/RimL family protein N-acetyltransferase
MRTLTTARLELRPWEDSFADELYRLSSDERVMRFIGDGRPWTRERTAQRHREHVAHWREHGFGWRALFEGRRFTGVGALSFLGDLVPGIEASALEIGWWVDPSAWGRGLATEAALALREEAFGELGAERIVGRYQPANVASGRVMAKLGMRVYGDIAGPAGEPVRVCELDRPGWRALQATEV